MANLILDPLVLKDIDPLTLDFPVFVEMYNGWQGWESSRPQLRMAEWLQETQEHRYRCLQAYRKATKSTGTSLYVPWRLARDAMWTVMLISAGNELIDRNSRFIRAVIEEFPICQGWDMKPDDPELWKTAKFTVKRPRQVLNPSVNIRSIESKITGQRAKDLIIDDVEVMENVETEEQRAKLKQRVRALENLDAAQLFIGTPHDEDTIYRVLEESKKGFIFLRIPVRGAYVNGVYADNGKLANPDVPIDGVMQDDAWVEEKRGALTDGEFQSQYLLIPAKAAKSLLRLDLINHYGDTDDVRGGLSYDPVDEHLRRLHPELTSAYFVDGQEVLDLVAFWDPSSAAKGRDDSALSVLASTVRGDVYLLHIELLSEVEPGQSFDTQCDEVLDVLFAFGLEKVYVESNFSPGLAGQLRKRARKRRRRIKVKQIHATGGKAKVGSGGTVGKAKRIAKAFDPVFKSGFYVHHSVWHGTAFRRQLMDFPGSKKDDLIDSVAWGIYQLKLPHIKAPKRDKEERPDERFRKEPKGRVVNKFDPNRRGKPAEPAHRFVSAR